MRAPVVAASLVGGVVLVAGAVAVVVWLLDEDDDVGDGAEAAEEVANTTTHTIDEKTEIGSAGGLPISVRLRRVSASQWMRFDAADAFVAMSAAAKAAGVTLVVNSAFRSREEQTVLHQKYLDGVGNLAAPPGYSNHEGGLSVDISTGGKGRDSAEFKWLAANAARFGFVNDVSSEPWHWTFKL